MTREQSRVVSVSGGTLVGGENLVAYWRSFFVSFSRFISFSFACPCPPLLTYMGPFPLVHGASSHSFSPCLGARRFLQGKRGRGGSCSMEAAAAARNSVCVISGKASSPRGSSISYRDHVENDGDEEARPLAETRTPEWLRRRISSPHGSSPPVRAVTPAVWRPGLGQAPRRRVAGGGSLDRAVGDCRGARSCVPVTPSCRFELLSSVCFLQVLICTSTPPSLSTKFELETVKSLAGGRG